MKKIEFWRKVKENGGGCYNIPCSECPYNKKGDGCTRPNSTTKKDAESYIKRHEQKSKKKDHIRDATKKVEEPKPVEEPTPLDIAKMIRDNGYSCLGLIKNCPPCPLWGKGGCGTSDKIVEEKHIKRKQLIDNYISANEPKPVKTVGIDNDDVTFARPTVKENLSVPCEHLINGDSCGNAFEPCDKDCPANPEIPQPIKFEDPVPENVYVPVKDCIRFYNVIEYVLKKRKTLKSSTDEFLIYLRNPRTNDTLWVDARECYRTPEEAVIVAKKLWGDK